MESAPLFLCHYHTGGWVEVSFPKREIDFGLEELEHLLQGLRDVLRQSQVRGMVWLFSKENNVLYPDFQELHQLSKNRQQFVRQIEKLLLFSYHIEIQDKPILSVVEGRCIGLTAILTSLAHYRISTQNTLFGFEEPKYGLFPFLGTSRRIKRLLGLEGAIVVLTQGRTYSAVEVQKMGWVHEVTDTYIAALDRVRNGFCVPESSNPSQNEVTSILHDKRTSGLIPGVDACLELLAVAESLPIEEQLSKEADLLADVISHSTTVNMLRTLYYGVKTAKEAPLVVHGVETGLYKIGVLGAGMMGSGIAYEAAHAGIQVVLKDISLEQANKGKTYSEKVTAKQVQRQIMTAKEQEELLERIKVTDNNIDLQEADVIVEAVFEEFALKTAIIRETFPCLSKNGFFASNTTSLPISRLAGGVSHPERFIGLHFFSPVDRMALVEVILGKETSKETLSKALTCVHQLGKVPIVVHDGPAFFTSRIFFHYLLEGITLILEGVPLSVIEENAQKAGFAVGPLAVLDEISLQLMIHVYDQMPELHASQQRAYDYLKRMVDVGRNGRKSGKGFYDYPADGGRKQYWDNPELAKKVRIDDHEIRDRLLHVVALDSYRCLDQKILNKPIDGDIGSLLGIGYAAQTGGVFAYMDSVGLARFAENCQRFEQYGEQWIVPDSMKQLAKSGFRFYSDFESNY